MPGPVVSLDDLAGPELGRWLHRLRAVGPVTWLDCIDGWFVTGRIEARDAMRDAERFTVDDPRFTTARVVGQSMLSTDGDEHRRHRSPFVSPFRRSVVVSDLDHRVNAQADQLVLAMRPHGRADLRSALAGPLAVQVIADVLDLTAATTDVLGWYRSIVNGVTELSAGGDEPSAAATEAVEALGAALTDTGMHRFATEAGLSAAEVNANLAVVLFGAVETTEAMILNLVWHLLADRSVVARLRSDPPLIDQAIEESLRLEPAASVVDRYATARTRLGSATIERGDLVRISLAGANRDPLTYPDPDTFNLDRDNSATQLAFAQGPHACLGAHLARLEARAAIAAMLDHLDEIELIGAESTPPTGLIFRKPERLVVQWG